MFRLKEKRMAQTVSQSNNNPVWYLAKMLWRYSAGNRPQLILYVLLFCIANGIAFVEPLIIARILDTIQASGVTGASLPTLLLYLGALLALNIGFWIFHGPARILEFRNAFIVRAQYKQYLLDGVLALPIEWHTDHHSGNTIDKIEKGTRALKDFANRTFQIIEAFIRLTSSYIVLVYFNPPSAVIVAGMVTLTVIMIMQFDRRLVLQYKQLNKAENEIAQKIFDVISNVTTVVILRIERLVSSAIYKKIMAPFSLFDRNNKLSETKWFLVFTASSLMTVLVLGSYFYTSLAAGTTVLVGTVYALYGYLDRISGLFFRFASMYGDILQQKASVQNAEEVAKDFLDQKASAHHALRDRWMQLLIRNLRFSYDAAEGTRQHLDGVDMTIQRGQRIALIGASGSGKTTFLKVFRELYQPKHVELTLDGSVLEGGFSDISADIALIPQDPEIFSTTILENITVGVSYPSAYVQRFTDMACATEMIERLPHKLKSYIHEKGVNLSGGERQRLALARGLMACDDKQIVLLDEPTSSVDTRNELKIFHNIFEAFDGKTILASVHRLHLLSLFDQIYYFKAGQIIASGTLEQLLKESQDFKDTWDKYHTVTKRRSR